MGLPQLHRYVAFVAGRPKFVICLASRGASSSDASTFRHRPWRTRSARLAQEAEDHLARSSFFTDIRTKAPGHRPGGFICPRPHQIVAPNRSRAPGGIDKNTVKRDRRDLDSA